MLKLTIKVSAMDVWMDGPTPNINKNDSIHKNEVQDIRRILTSID